MHFRWLHVNTSEFLSDSRTQCSMSRLETRSIRVGRLACCGPGPMQPERSGKRAGRSPPADPSQLIAIRNVQLASDSGPPQSRQAGGLGFSTALSGARLTSPRTNRQCRRTARRGRKPQAQPIPAHASDGLDVNGLNCCARASSSACSIKKPVRPPLSSSASSKAASRCPISSPRFCAESIISDLHPFSAC
jgi:hypothetical protein